MLFSRFSSPPPLINTFLCLLLCAGCEEVPATPTDAGLFVDARGDTNAPNNDEDLAAPWDDSSRLESLAGAINGACLDVSETLAEPPPTTCFGRLCGAAPSLLAAIDVTCADTTCGAFSRMGTITNHDGELIVGGEFDLGVDGMAGTDDDIPLPSGFTAEITEVESASNLVVASARIRVQQCQTACTRAAAIAFFDRNTSDLTSNQLDVVASARLVAHPPGSNVPQVQFVVGTNVVHTIDASDNTPVDVQLVLAPSGEVAFFAGGEPFVTQLPVPPMLGFAVYGYGATNNQPDAVIEGARVGLSETFWPASGTKARLESATIMTQFASGGSNLRLERITETDPETEAEATELVLMSADGNTSVLTDLYPDSEVRLVYHAGLTESRYGLWWNRGVDGFAYAPIEPMELGDNGFNGGALSPNTPDPLCQQSALPPGVAIVDMLMYQGVPLILGRTGRTHRLYGIDAETGVWRPIVDFVIDRELNSASVTRAFGHLFVAMEVPSGTRSRLELLVAADGGARETFELVIPSGDANDSDAFGAQDPSVQILGDRMTVYYTGDSRLETSRMSIETAVPELAQGLQFPLAF